MSVTVPAYAYEDEDGRWQMADEPEPDDAPPVEEDGPPDQEPWFDPEPAVEPVPPDLFELEQRQDEPKGGRGKTVPDPGKTVSSRKSWQPLNLANLEDRPPIKPTLGGVGFVYPGKRHVFSGPQESAKTLAAYAIALEEVRSGGMVLLIDFEMGSWDARDRLREMGATDDDFERIPYVDPDTPATADTIIALLALGPTLVIIDAAAGAYDLQGLDDNKRADVEKFARIYVRRFWLNGVATILIDHVVKNIDNRGRYAIGSERKVGGSDVHLGFEPIKPLGRGGLGLYKIVTHKDRGGWLPRGNAAEITFNSDPDTHALTWEIRPASSQPDAHDGTSFRPTVLMERVSRYLETQVEPVSRTNVESAKLGNTDYVRVAMDTLVREGYAEETAGARRARLLESIRAFRNNDSAPTPPMPSGVDSAPDSAQTEPLNHAVSTTPPDSAHTPPMTPLHDSAQPGEVPYRGTPVDGAESDHNLLDEIERLQTKHADLL